MVTRQKTAKRQAMSQSDEFNARVQRTFSETDQEVERDRRRSAWSLSATSLLHGFVLSIGVGVVWAICLVAGTVIFVAVAFGVSLGIAMAICVLAVVVIAALTASGSGE